MQPNDFQAYPHNEALIGIWRAAIFDNNEKIPVKDAIELHTGG